MAEFASKEFGGFDYYSLIKPDLKKIRALVNSIENQMSKINDDDDIETMKSRISVLQNDMEKLAIQGRSIPLYKERKTEISAYQKNENVRITYEKDVVTFEIPLLLPKTRLNKANKEYLVGMYHDVFKDYFKKADIEKYKEPVVIWFDFQYKKRNGKQGFRDHDNLETKVIKDLLSPYLVTDDSPSYCDDFNSSRVGRYDATFIHVVPQRKFAEYYTEKVSEYGDKV